MRLKFLCEGHRRQLKMQPDYARDLWRKGVGQLVPPEELPANPRTVGLAGSALEAAGIYMLAASEPENEDIGLYADTALILIELLLAVRENRLAIVVLAGTSAVLEQLALEGACLQACIEASKRLTRVGMRRIESRDSRESARATTAVRRTGAAPASASKRELVTVH